MPDLTNPHDRFFKETFGRPELAADFLQHYLPPSVAALLDPDPASLTRRHDSFVDEKLRAHMSDLVFEARLRDESAALIYVLFEHKSRPEPMVAFQLLRYLVRLWEHDLRAGRPLLPVVPVVVYHGRRRWRVAQNFGALFVGPAALRPYWPEFRYDLTDLSQHGEAEIRGAVATQVWVELLRHIYDRRLGAELPRIAGLMQDLMDRSRVTEMLATMLEYVVQASSAVTEEDLQATVQAAEEPAGGGAVPTLAETWMREGREQGLELGREEGRERGLREGLLAGIEMGLQLRFASLGLAILPEIADIEDVATLRAVRDALLTARSLDDVRHVYA